jgi:hypothetical protein
LKATNAVDASSTLAIFPELVEQLGQEGLVSIGQEAAGFGGIGLERIDLALAPASATAAGAAARSAKSSALEDDRNLLNTELNEAKGNLIVVSILPVAETVL